MLPGFVGWEREALVDVMERVAANAPVESGRIQIRVKIQNSPVLRFTRAVDRGGQVRGCKTLLMKVPDGIEMRIGVAR
jgi:hypothetical protein